VPWPERAAIKTAFTAAESSFQCHWMIEVFFLFPAGGKI
jgi:hypothetical protein